MSLTDASLSDVPDLITLEDAARRTHRTPEALRFDLRHGRFEHIRIGHGRFFTPAQFLKMLRQQTVLAETGEGDLDTTRARVARQRARRAAAGRVAAA